jgi:hypothetical protein
MFLDTNDEVPSESHDATKVPYMSDHSIATSLHHESRFPTLEQRNQLHTYITLLWMHLCKTPTSPTTRRNKGFIMNIILRFANFFPHNILPLSQNFERPARICPCAITIDVFFITPIFKCYARIYTQGRHTSSFNNRYITLEYSSFRMV